MCVLRRFWSQIKVFREDFTKRCHCNRILSQEIQISSGFFNCLQCQLFYWGYYSHQFCHSSFLPRKPQLPPGFPTLHQGSDISCFHQKSTISSQNAQLNYGAFSQNAFFHPGIIGQLMRFYVSFLTLRRPNIFQEFQFFSITISHRNRIFCSIIFFPRT